MWRRLISAGSGYATSIVANSAPQQFGVTTVSAGGSSKFARLVRSQSLVYLPKQTCSTQATTETATAERDSKPPASTADDAVSISTNDGISALLPDVSHGNAVVTDDYPDTGFGIDRSYMEAQEDVDPDLYTGTNHLHKKKNYYRLRHPLTKQIAYMKSEAFTEAYKGLPIYMWFRRNTPHSDQYHPKIRLRCLDNNYRYISSNPCPVCRDEYLWFDFRDALLVGVAARKEV